MATANATSSSFLVPATAVASTPSACPSTLPKKNAAGRWRRTVQCRASGGRGDDDSGGLLWLPRREVLTGLSGVAAGFVGYPDLASIALEANPVESCRRGEKVTDKLVECSDPNRDFPCPPESRIPIVDFTPEAKVTRIRRPAHLLDPEYQAKYKEAVGKMRALDKSNPLSFAAQAAIHESYCDGHYQFDPTEKNRPFDVHFSWIFAPWHRMYLYFYERALGDLIGDDTFALPYWSWDTPAGMGIPAIFKGVSTAENPLYDPYRNMDNKDALIDLDYLKTPRRPTIPFKPPPESDAAARKAYDDAVRTNLCTIYIQQVRDGKGPRAYLGEKLCSEASIRVKEINERSKRRDGQNKVTPSKSQSQGTLERMAHTTVHVWAGRSSPKAPATCSVDQGGVVGHDGKPHCNNDMGFLGTAGRDPLFYSHHSNVDRMWHLWSTKLGGKGFDDPEWLDTSFVFYDDVKNPRLVGMKFRDVLDTANLGYTYDKESEAALPWLKSKPTRFSAGTKTTRVAPALKVASEFPLTLTKEAVDVPSVAIPAKQPGKDLVLLIEGIEYDPQINNKFDVIINVPKEDAGKVGPKDSEYAGSFSAVPSSNAAGGTVVGKFTLYLDGVLADLGLTNESAVDIVLVPHTAEEIKIYLPPTIENA